MPRLVINPNTTSAWQVQLKPGTNLLGRGFANDFKIENPSVSSSHCQIVVDGTRAVIRDLGSTNGTFVNRGRRLAPGDRCLLKDGDEIIVGKTFLRFRLTK